MPDSFDLNDQRTAMAALEAERRRINLSLHEMEARSGVSINSVYAWRSCARSPTMETLTRFADALGFEIVLERKK